MPETSRTQWCSSGIGLAGKSPFNLHRSRLYGAGFAPALSGLAIGVAPPRPNLAGRLQFTFIVAGFLSLLVDAHLGWPLRTVGIRILAFGAVPATLMQAYAFFGDAPAWSTQSSS